MRVLGPGEVVDDREKAAPAQNPSGLESKPPEVPSKGDEEKKKARRASVVIEKQPRRSHSSSTGRKESTPTKAEIERPEAGHRGHGRTSSSRGSRGTQVRSGGGPTPAAAAAATGPRQVNFVETRVRPLPQARPRRTLSSYAQNIFWLLGASTLLVTIILGVSLGTTRGASSYWVCPAVGVLTVFFTAVVVLGLMGERKEREREGGGGYEVEVRHTQFNLHESASVPDTVVVTDLRATERGQPAQTPRRSIVERRATNVCAWTLCVLWVVCITPLTTNLILRATSYRRLGGGSGYRGSIVVEMMLVFLEACVMQKVAQYCYREWKWAQ